MKNFVLSFSDVSGGSYIYDESTGQEIILKLMGNDIRPPLTNMHIEAKTKDGKTIRINVPNTTDEEALIEIE
ncbi:MAG: hypothetical protein M0Q21_10780 [Ignavibacteriaceae bacterium]|nr:hypothetical protein [Ignavibacteriaceae bacterium]